VTVLDASALIAYLLDEPARAEVGDLLRKRPPPSISAVNLEGRPAERVNDAIDLLLVSGLEVQPFWLPNARRSAALRSTFYDRSTSALSLADCACLATAVALKTDLATSDAPLARAARAVGVDVIELPRAGMDMAELLDPNDPEVADVIRSTRVILEGLRARPYLERLDAAVTRRSAAPPRAATTAATEVPVSS